MSEATDKAERPVLDRLSRLFYIASWLPHYRAKDLRGDVAAGLTVGVMLIPQSMAYAILAGVPPIYGLYASLVPLLVYPFFGTSRHLAVGTIAIDMLIVAAGLGTLAEPGSARYISLAILLTLMVGTIQVLMGAARMGFLVNLLSRPVIIGFTSAAALIIASSQLGNLFGLDLPQSQYVHVLLWEAVERVGQIQVLPAVLGLAGVVLLVGLKKWKPLFPAPLAAVVLGTLAVWQFHWDQHGVEVVGAIPTGLPTLAVPALDVSSMGKLVSTAVTLALVQFMTVISLGKVFAARNRYSIRANRELLAVGASNMFGSFFHSIPVSGSFSRTAVNAQAGVRSALSNIVAAGLIGLTLLFLTSLFYYLPIPVLAAIIIVAAVGLFDYRELRRIFRIKRIDGGVALLTFACTLLVGIQQGILIGIAASVVAIMYRISRPNVAVLGHLPGTRSFRDVDRNEEALVLEGIMILRVDASFSFANAEFLKDLLLRRSEAEDSEIRAVIIDASSINDLDTTAAAVLLEASETLRDRDIELYFGGVKEPVLDTMERSGLREMLGADHFFLSPHRAVKHVLEAWGASGEYLQAVPDSDVHSRDDHSNDSSPGEPQPDASSPGES